VDKINSLNRSLEKELKPLLLPWCVAAVGGLIPFGDELEAVLGTLLSFGGFAVLAAMVHAIEFQERTLPLLLSLPAERWRLWGDKLVAIAIAAISLACLNWRVHGLLAGFPIQDLGPLVGWLFLMGTICSLGFWIVTTRSVLLGIALSFGVQFVVFIGLGLAAAEWVVPGTGIRGGDFAGPLVVGGLVYCGAFIWLGREFWKTQFLSKAGAALLVLVMFGAGQILEGYYGANRETLLDLCYAALFVLATLGSVAWWTLIARTTIGGAVLTVAAQFVAVLGLQVGLSLFTGADMGFGDSRLPTLVCLGAPLYSALFLWGGWRRFSRLEVTEPSYGEGLLAPGKVEPGHSRWSWLRCRAGEGLLNLGRKELRLQKPLLLLAAVFSVCWLAVFALQWLQPHHGYENVGDVLVCLFMPLALVLAGSLSLGEEKTLSVASWHLALPVSATRQWLVKLGVGAFTGAVLGLVLPLGLAWVSSWANEGGLLLKENKNGWIALASISGGLFVIGFWAATLVANTIRAALIAVAGLVPLFLCGMAGSWCAQQTCGFPHGLWVALGVGGGPEVPGFFGVVGFVVIVASIALVQSLLQFRRIRIPTATVFTHSLVLGGGVVLGSFWWTAVLLSTGR